MFKSREKKFINLNNVIAEIRKVKRTEKEIALTNSMKTITFKKKWFIINNIIPQSRWIVLNKQIFEIETGKLLVKNPSEKWEGITFLLLLFFAF